MIEKQTNSFTGVVEYSKCTDCGMVGNIDLEERGHSCNMCTQTLHDEVTRVIMHAIPKLQTRVSVEEYHDLINGVTGLVEKEITTAYNQGKQECTHNEFV